MEKKLLAIVMLATLMIGSTLVDGLHLSLAQSATQVNGIINSDTTWTKANSPYHFIGDVYIPEGVTLTIEPGVTVEFTQATTAYDQYGRPFEKDYTYNLQINGTLLASRDIFTVVPESGSNGYQASTFNFWNTSSNSVLQDIAFTGNFIINTIGSSPRFYQDSNFVITINDGSPIVEGCNFGRISAYGSSPVGISIFGGSPEISNNTISGGVMVAQGSPVISNNTITSERYGVALFNGSNQSTTALVSDNYISGSLADGGVVVNSGTPIVQRNFISGENVGIAIYGDTKPFIENNTIAANTKGINIYDSPDGSPVPTITGNNFEQNTQYNIYLGEEGSYGSTARSLNAANNWWGTTDIPSINQTIHDHKNDFNLGTVTFIPLLTEPNPQAMPNPSLPPASTPMPSTSPITTPTPTSTPTATYSLSPSPSQNPPTSPVTSQQGLYEIITALIVIVIVLIVVIFLLVTKKKR